VIANLYRKTPSNRGYGFVKFETNELQQAALATLNDTPLRIKDRDIAVNVAFVRNEPVVSGELISSETPGGD